MLYISNVECPNHTFTGMHFGCSYFHWYALISSLVCISDVHTFTVRHLGCWVSRSNLHCYALLLGFILIITSLICTSNSKCLDHCSVIYIGCPSLLWHDIKKWKIRQLCTASAWWYVSTSMIVLSWASLFSNLNGQYLALYVMYTSHPTTKMDVIIWFNV